MLTKEERNLLEKHIYNIVKNAINENLSLIAEDENNKKNTSNLTDNNKRRKIILKWLNNPALNQTAIMKQLWRPDKDEEDSKRSLFFKKLHGELNDNGIPYQFSDEEVTQLFKIKSQGAIG